ncbi:MAG: hypothetical protein U9Q30_02960, partial [Campylobacterota bacterium]|nr:hypothetical protein [Campylobacterota bacterium]
MNFKNIKEFYDLYNISNKELGNLILNHSKDIKEFNKINLEEYNTNLSKIIYFLIETIKNKKQEDFNKSFECCLIYMQKGEFDSINDFAYIIEMLLFISKTFKFNIDDWINKYYEEIYKINDSLNLLWFNEALIKNKYCNDKKLIDYNLLNLNYHHTKDYLEILDKYCKKINIEELYINYAKKLEKLASKDKGYKSIYFYELAIDIYRKYNKTSDINRLNNTKNNIQYDLNNYSIEIPMEEINRYIVRIKKVIDEKLIDKDTESVFNILFSNLFLPKKDDNIKNTIEIPSTLRMFGNIVSIGSGRKQVFKEEDKNRYLQFKNYCISL